MFKNIEYLSFISDSEAGIISRFVSSFSLDSRLVKMFRKSVFSPGNVGVTTSRFILREVCLKGFLTSIQCSVRMPVLVTQRVSRARSVPRVTGAAHGRYHLPILNRLR